MLFVLAARSEELAIKLNTCWRRRPWKGFLLVENFVDSSRLRSEVNLTKSLDSLDGSQDSQLSSLGDSSGYEADVSDNDSDRE